MDLFDVEPPIRKRRRPIGPGNWGEGFTFFDEPAAEGSLSAGERDEMLDELSNSSGQTVSALARAIDYPSALIRGTLMGRPGSTPSGEELLAHYGMLPSQSALGGWGRPLASFAVEATVDPLNLLTFGGSALTKAGRVAKAAGLLEDAGKVASRQVLNSGLDLSSFGRNAASSWMDNFGKGLDDLTDADLAARPLVGPRMARRQVTLGDVVNAQDDVPDAIRRVDDAAGWSDYASLQNQRLGGDIGVQIPFTNIGASVRLPFVGQYMAGGLDRAFQALRWSAPGRYAHSMFNNEVAGNVDEGGQILAKQVTDARRLGEAAGRSKASSLLQKLPESSFTPSNQQMLRRVLSGPNVASASDIAAVRSSPGMQNLVDEWRRMAPDYIARSKQAGIGSAELSDPFGTLYFPRHANRNLFPELYTNQGTGKLDFSTLTGDMMARSDSLKVPGGEAFIQRMSLDPNVAGFNRSLSNDLDAADYIKRAADAEAARLFPGATPPVYTREQAIGMARLLHRIDPEAIKKGYPLFGSSVGEDLTRYLTGRERSLRVANTLYDAIASAARPQNFASVNTKIPGGGYRSYTSAREALSRLGLETTKDAAGNDVGAAKQLLDRLSAKFGPGAVADLDSIAIDERLFDRLTRISDFYSRPEAQNSLLKFLDDMTRMFKGSILAWPARFVRDWYSAIVSNFVEVGNPLDLRQGYQAARYLVQGQYDRLEPILASMPRYRRMAAAARREAFLTDLARSQVLTGRGLADVGDELMSDMAGTGLMSELVPGSTPRTTLGMQAADLLSLRAPLSPSRASYSELSPLLDPRKYPGGVARLAGQIRHPFKALAEKEVVNPILRWSNKTGDITDAINRSAGYIALLRQGIDPMEAARRIKSAQVDYNSLTKFEREFMRRIFPWYSYNSRILKHVVKDLWDHPGGLYSQFAVRLPEKLQQSTEDQYVPQDIKQDLGINLERLSGGSPLMRSLVGMVTPKVPGTTPYLVDIDLPGTDTLNLIAPRFDPETGSLNTLLTLKETGKNLINQMTPFFKKPYEFFTGQDMNTKRDLRSMLTTPQVVARNLFGVEPGGELDILANQVSPFVDFIPFAPRVGQTVRRLADAERIPDFSTRLAQTLFNTYTGTKIQNVSDESRTLDARQKIEELLSPYSSSFEQRYIPQERLPYMDPEVVRLYTLDRMLNREQRIRERDRKLARQSASPFFPGESRKARRKQEDPFDFFSDL